MVLLRRSWLSHTTIVKRAMKNDPVLTLPYEGSKDSKKDQIRHMFNRISTSYDLVNRVLSGGIDLYWRKMAVRALHKESDLCVLDVATGTGDLAIAIAKKTAAKVVAVDISNKMISIAQRKIAKKKLSGRITTMQADSEALPFAANSFHAATIAFGIRNFEHVEKSLHNLHRVLKPSGRLVILELSTPSNRCFANLYNLYSRGFLSVVGGVLSGHRQAYRYLWRSIKNFPEGQVLVDILEKAGFKNVSCQTLTGGICSLYVAKK